MIDPLVAAVNAIAEPIAIYACAHIPTLESCDVLAEIHLALLEQATGESLVRLERVHSVAFSVAARCMRDETNRLRQLASLRRSAYLLPDGVLLQ